MPRSVTFAAFGGVAVLLLVPARAVAQPGQFTPSIVPPNPLYQMTPYSYQLNIGVTVPTTFGRTFVGGTVPFTRAPQTFSPNYWRPPLQPWNPSSGGSMGYMYAGSVSGFGTPGQRDFQKAQQAAGQMRLDAAAKEAIQNQWAYEKMGAVVSGDPKPAAPAANALELALAPVDEVEVTSGRALNHILDAVVAAEAAGAKGPSAYLQPRLLEETRFGTPAGEALNLVRQSRRLPFPAAFAAPELADLRDLLEKDLAAVSAPVLTGKPADPTKLAKLEETLKRVEAAAAPVIRNQSFEDAIVSRKFLNQFGTAVRGLKANGGAGLVVPTWATEGASVAELVKHMTKFKLRFAPAPLGGESTYFALHRALAAYYFVLNQPKK